MRALLSIILILSMPFAGCLDNSGTPAESSPTATSSAAATPTNTSAPPPVANLPPTANLSASVLNGSAPLSVTFDILGDDPEGAELSWTLDADGQNGTDANGTGLPASFNFTFALPGNYTANLTVTDGNASANASVTISVLAGKKGGSVTADDPSGDSDLSYTDLRNVVFTLTEEHLIAVLKLTDLWPTNQVLTPVVYNFHLNNRIFKSLGRYPIDSAPMTWDTGAGAYMPAGTSKWDASAKTVTFTIPLAYLEEKEVKAPYLMFGSVSIGAITNEAKQSDRAPNAGVLELG